MGAGGKRPNLNRRRAGADRPLGGGGGNEIDLWRQAVDQGHLLRRGRPVVGHRNGVSQRRSFQDKSRVRRHGHRQVRQGHRHQRSSGSRIVIGIWVGLGRSDSRHARNQARRVGNGNDGNRRRAIDGEVGESQVEVGCDLRDAGLIIADALKHHSGRQGLGNDDVASGARSGIGHRQVIDQVASHHNGGRVGGHRQGKVRAGTLAPAIRADIRGNVETPTLESRDVLRQLEGIKHMQHPYAVEIGPIQKVERGERLLWRIGPNVRRRSIDDRGPRGIVKSSLRSQHATGPKILPQAAVVLRQESNGRAAGADQFDAKGIVINRGGVKGYRQRGNRSQTRDNDRRIDAERAGGGYVVGRRVGERNGQPDCPRRQLD